MRIIKFIGAQAKLLMIVAIAAVVGGTATAVVSASIPDSGGTIHGCYNKNTGALKVVDSDAGQNCNNKQNALNWSVGGGGGGAAGYIYATTDSNTGITTMDSSRSSGVSNFVAVPTGAPANPELACVTFSTTPNTYAVTSVGDTPSPSNGDIKNQTGWLDNNAISGGMDSPFDMLCDQNAPGSNAWFLPNGNNGTGIMTIF